MEQNRATADSAAVLELPPTNPDEEPVNFSEVEVAFLDKISSNPAIKKALKSPSLRVTILEALNRKKDQDDNSLKKREDNLREQAYQGGGGIQPAEETFLKELILNSVEFKDLLKELMTEVIDD